MPYLLVPKRIFKTRWRWATTQNRKGAQNQGRVFSPEGFMSDTYRTLSEHFNDTNSPKRCGFSRRTEVKYRIIP